MNWQLVHADCRDVMANMGDCSVDSVVCDPPYHLTSIVKRFGPGSAPQQYGTDGAFSRAVRGFMGQTWDGGDIAFDPELWREVWRVLKPGGHLVAFSGTRTYHRMAVAIEDAGFEIRDMLGWIYGSGFPKSHDISKAIDKAAGATREVVGYDAAKAAQQTAKAGTAAYGDFAGNPGAITAPATAEAQQWEGWGTALKPAQEPICFARKPLIGTVAANVLEHGTGAINIDGCRVEAPDGVPVYSERGEATVPALGSGLNGSNRTGEVSTAGRFPANIMHDGSDEVLAVFPREAGGGDKRGAEAGDGIPCAPGYADTGSAARFFYCAKASKSDREEGLDFVPPDPETGRANPHPTVKPEGVMRWLCRLVTPPGGLIFDPFTGSGSTGKAAVLEGFRFIGAEMTAEYIPVARARIAAAVDRAVKQR